MTDTTVTTPMAVPIVPPPTPDEQTLVTNLLQAVIALLPIVGIAVPAVLSSNNTLWMISGVIVSVAGGVAALWSLWSHKTKNTALVKARAAAVWHKDAAARLRVVASAKGSK